MTASVRHAADCITEADAILIAAGAGIGVDSGLPDFRGNEGFWKAYPPMKKLGLSFYDLANPVWFSEDPQRAWGFYGHRRNLYRETEPHKGFKILREWCEQKSGGGFVFTSNVDGHFQKAGFDESNIVECHGAINFSQCVSPCCHEIWEAEPEAIEVDLNTFQASVLLPECKSCSRSARPNVLMFGDYSWVDSRTNHQYSRYEQWLGSVAQAKVAIIELGAGTAVPTVRYQCEQMARRLDDASHIRINPREAHGRNAISIEMGALDAIEMLNSMI